MVQDVSLPAEQARSHELRGDLATAQSLWRECVDLDPSRYECWLGYGRSLYLSGDHSPAREALCTALERDSKGAEALFFLARVELELGDLPSAQKAFRKAVALDPLLDHPKVRIRLLGGQDFGEMLEADERHGPRRVLLSPPTPMPTFNTYRKPHIPLGQYWGYDMLKDRLRHEVVEPFEATQGKPQGVLLYGPQDCGKQFIARALACELEASVLEFECETLENMRAREEAERDLQQFLLSVPPTRARVVTLLRLEKLFTTTQMSGPAQRGMPAALGFLHPVLAERRVLVVFHSDVPWLLSRSMLDSRWLKRSYFVPPPDITARAQIVDSAFGTAIPPPMRDMLLAHTEGFTTGDLSELTIMLQQHVLRQRELDPEVVSRYLEEDRSHSAPIDWSMLPSVLSQVQGGAIEWLREARSKQVHRRFPPLLEFMNLYLPPVPVRPTRSRAR